MTLTKHLRSQLQNSCAQSSMRGISRTVKTKNKSLKAIWIIGVLTLLAICVFSVYDVLENYFTYPSTTTITDSLITSRNIENTFLYDHVPPDTTICNLNPFRSDYKKKMETEHIPTLDDYLERKNAFKNSYQEHYYYFQNKLDSLLGYFQFIGPENASKLSHSADDLIVDCSIIGFGFLGFETFPCNRSGQISRYMTPEYFSCYTIGFNGHVAAHFGEQGFYILGVEVILYVDNFITESDTFFKQNSAAGVAVAVHEHKRKFIPMLNTIPVAVGTDTNLKLKWELREKLNHPYGDCLQEDQEDNNRHKNNLITCIGNCAEEVVKNACGCITGFYESTVSFTNQNATPYCLTLKEDFDTVANRTYCMSLVMELNVDTCVATCHSLCREYKYHKNSFSAKWPTKSRQVPFYETYIKGSSYQSKFAVFENIIKLKKGGNYSKANKLLQETTLIEDNFIKISAYLSSIDVVTAKDHIAVTAYDLLAKIGGTLNLYSGISFIIIVELIDLLYNILFSFRKDETIDESKTTKVSPVCTNNYSVA